MVAHVYGACLQINGPPCSGSNLFDAIEGGVRAGNVVEAQVVVQRRLAGSTLETRDEQQGLDLRGEPEGVAMARHKEWFDPEGIANQVHGRCRLFPGRKGIHAVDLLERGVHAHTVDQCREYLGVRSRRESVDPMSGRELAEIVDLAIGDHHHRAALHGLGDPLERGQGCPACGDRGQSDVWCGWRHGLGHDGTGWAACAQARPASRTDSAHSSGHSRGFHTPGDCSGRLNFCGHHVLSSRAAACLPS